MDQSICQALLLYSCPSTEWQIFSTALKLVQGVKTILILYLHAECMKLREKNDVIFSFFDFFLKKTCNFLLHFLLRYWNSFICYMSYFVKAIVLLELLKAIYFSIRLTSRIRVMRLFIFMRCFSVNLGTYNLNISRM